MSTKSGGEVQSREKKGRAYPNPPPKTPIAERLERVRTEFGYQSKAAFHRALTEGDDYDVSYEAVRNYHYDRDPPPSYLARIAELFRVRLDYLIRDRGPMTEDEARASEHAEAASETRDRQRYEAWRLKLEILAGMGVVPEVIDAPAVPAKLERAENFRAWATRVNISYIPPWVPALAEVRARYGRRAIDADAIGRALRGPLEAVGIDPAEGVDHTYRTLEWLDDYIMGMVPVLLALGPERRQQRDSSGPEDADDA